MRNIKLTIEYEATNYCGWQVQNKRTRKKERTIQQTLERCLARILQEHVKVIGSGRTDAGVHAQGQIANFKTQSDLSCHKIQRALNSLLPEDIRIKKVCPTYPNFHARFCAQSKHYRYTIVNHSFVSPQLRQYVYLVKCPLDLRKMRKGARYLLGKHDFRSFQAVDKSRKGNSVRTIKRLHIRNYKHIIYLDIKADGFLYRMARNIVGTLIEVGRSKLNPLQIKEILKAKNRTHAGPCVPAKGLSLVGVQYKS